MKRDILYVALLIAALLVLNVYLNATLARRGEGPYVDSIEHGYAGMANFFYHHPDPFGWNPYQYGGLPAQMWYVPGIPYLSAAWHAIADRLRPDYYEVKYSYRMVVVMLASMTPAAVFLFVWVFNRSRLWALLSAIAVTFLSPGYWLYQQLVDDMGRAYLPWRLQTLALFGEGPHNAGLTLLFLALAACWWCATSRGYTSLFVAAVALAIVPLTNWLSAMALTLCCLLLLLAGFATGPETCFRGRRIIGAGVLGYLLACFWLTPTFVYTIAFNWPEDAYGYRMRNRQRAALIGVLLLLFVIRYVFRRYGSRTYLCFVTLCATAYFCFVSTLYWFGIPVIPEAHRYAPELDVFLLLLAVEIIRQAWQANHRAWKAVAAAGLAAMVWFGYPQAHDYLTRVPLRLRPGPKEKVIEYRVAKAVAELRPEGRVFVTGSARFHLNAWTLTQQLGGTFESGLRNRNSMHLSYFIIKGLGRDREFRAEDALRTLRVAGVEYVVSHGPKSAERYRDLQPWDMFDGLANAAYREPNDVIYRLPFTGLAHLARPEEYPVTMPVGEYTVLAKAFVAGMDDPSRPRLRFQWLGTSDVEISGVVPDGMVVSARVAYDEGWEATQDGAPVTIERDPMGFMLIRARPSPDGTVIRLRFAGHTEHKIFTGISASAWMIALAALVYQRRRQTWAA